MIVVVKTEVVSAVRRRDWREDMWEKFGRDMTKEIGKMSSDSRSRSQALDETESDC
jgi:hypothetical protein